MEIFFQLENVQATPPSLTSNGNTSPQISRQMKKLRENPAETPRAPTVETPQPSPVSAPHLVSPSVPGPSRDTPRQIVTGVSLGESSNPGGGKYPIKQTPSFGAMVTPGEALGRVTRASFGDQAVPPWFRGEWGSQAQEGTRIPPRLGDCLYP